MSKNICPLGQLLERAISDFVSNLARFGNNNGFLEISAISTRIRTPQSQKTTGQAIHGR